MARVYCLAASSAELDALPGSAGLRGGPTSLRSAGARVGVFEVLTNPAQPCPRLAGSHVTQRRNLSITETGAAARPRAAGSAYRLACCNWILRPAPSWITIAIAPWPPPPAAPEQGYALGRGFVSRTEMFRSLWLVHRSIPRRETVPKTRTPPAANLANSRACCHTSSSVAELLTMGIPKGVKSRETL